MGKVPVPNWTVPYQRNPFFTGREEVLTQLHTQLQANQRAALSQPIAMSGLGGIGKTQSAVEYAYRYRSEYLGGVYWIKSSTSEELAGDFASLAQLLQLPEQAVQEQAQIIKAVKNWFETHNNWLLIFDNADDLGIIAHYLPAGERGHVLITTRAYTMGGIAEKIEMQVMNLNEGARLLLKRAGMIDQAKPFEQVGEADLQQAFSIIQELGGLPLALDQAGAYLEETGESLASYLSLYKQQRTELLQRRGGLRSYHAPVATTWTLAFYNIEDSNPAAIELIKLFAFLAPDEIPEELLTLTAHQLPPSLQSLIANRMRFNEAIKALLDYSLIQRDRDSKTLSIHRLVQAVIKDQMSKTQQAQQAEYIVHMISDLFPFDEDAPWIRSQRYLSHALLAVEYIKQSSFTFGDARRLLRAIGVYLRSRGQYDEAESFLRQNRAITEKLLGPEHPVTATSLTSLANLYRDQGRYEQAEPLYQRALAIREKKQGLEHPATATSLTNLANLYTKQGKYEQAEALYQRALTTFKQRLGPDHLNTASCLDHFANFYQEQGKNEQAESLYQQALKIFEQRLGSDNPRTVKVLKHYSQLHPKI